MISLISYVCYVGKLKQTKLVTCISKKFPILISTFTYVFLEVKMKSHAIFHIQAMPIKLVYNIMLLAL